MAKSQSFEKSKRKQLLAGFVEKSQATKSPKERRNARENVYHCSSTRTRKVKIFHLKQLLV